MFQKILIANRGEIALRVIRACRDLGVRAVAVYSDADQESLHVRLADEAVPIGPALSRKSYLNMDALLEAARKSRADAVHPGYGFLAENPGFARACEDAGIAFIGPSPECMALAGNKAKARKHLMTKGVPVIPGSEGPVATAAHALDAAEDVGYPVILKASGGGGGKGMRIARDAKSLSEVFPVAAGEAKAAFDLPELYLEKYMERSRHIEVQVFSDLFGNAVHLGERECSIQKRHQKLIEESPSPFVDAALREKMGDTALTVVRSLGYTNAGTVEFLVAPDGAFYFMEMNARIQVEHPVTEMTTGIDLVCRQIRIASGEALLLSQKRIRPHGWALECRINAEDPDDGFMPSPGTVEELVLPGGPGIRVDTHLYPGYTVPPFYDSLVCKVIAWGKDRPTAISRMRRALFEVHTKGIQNTVSFHETILTHPDFIQGRLHTRFLEML